MLALKSTFATKGIECQAYICRSIFCFTRHGLELAPCFCFLNGILCCLIETAWKLVLLHRGRGHVFGYDVQDFPLPGSLLILDRDIKSIIPDKECCMVFWLWEFGFWIRAISNIFTATPTAECQVQEGQAFHQPLVRRA